MGYRQTEQARFADRERHLAPDARCPGEPRVEGRERALEELGERDVPGVVGGDVGPQLPDPVGEGLIREQVDFERLQIGVSQRGRVGRDLAGQGGPAQDIADLGSTAARKAAR